MRRGDASVWIEVQDDDTRPPRLRHASPEDEGGRGLALVHDLATAWGSRSTPTGKVVWLRLDAPSPAPVPAAPPVSPTTGPVTPLARPVTAEQDLLTPRDGTRVERVLDLTTAETEAALGELPSSRTRRRRHVHQD